MNLIKKAGCLCLILFAFTSSAQTLNKPLMAQLDKIYITDQLYRGKVVANAAAKYGWDSPQVSAIMRKQTILDIKNMAQVEKIIAKYGYPGKSLVGEKRKAIAFFVIQHDNLGAQKKYLPLVTAAADKGELNWSSVALMVDRVKTENGEKQIYGSQLLEQGRTRKLYPIEDEANVNIRRAKAGLPPLQEYLKSWNIKYQVPDAKGNPNPADLYVSAKPEEETSPVELIGGEDDLYAKLNYPKEAQRNKVEGWVTVELTVDKSGTTKNAIVVKGLGNGCDEEALRVIKEARFTNRIGEDHEIRMRLPFPYKKK